MQEQTKKPKIISFINFKGGVGKTTLSLNTAVGFANLYEIDDVDNMVEGNNKRKPKILVVDLDPQMNLTQSLIPQGEQYHTSANIKTLFDVLHTNREYLSNTIDFGADFSLDKYVTTKYGINLLASDINLQDIENQLLVDSYKKSRGEYVHAITYLKTAFNMFVDYDYIIIDCPPNLGLLTQNAIVASDYYIIPTKLDALSTQGINQLVSKISEIIQCVRKEDIACDPQLLGVVGTMVWVTGPSSDQKDFINDASAAVMNAIRQKVICNDKDLQSKIVDELVNAIDAVEQQDIKEYYSLSEETSGNLRACILNRKTEVLFNTYIRICIKAYAPSSVTADPLILRESDTPSVIRAQDALKLVIMEILERMTEAEKMYE